MMRNSKNSRSNDLFDRLDLLKDFSVVWKKALNDQNANKTFVILRMRKNESKFVSCTSEKSLAVMKKKMSDNEEIRDLFKNSTLKNQNKVLSRFSELNDFRIHAVKLITSFIKRNILLRWDKFISSFKKAKIIRLLMRQNKTKRNASKIEDKCRIFQLLLREDEYRLSRKNDLVAMLQSNNLFSFVSVCATYKRKNQKV
jgi:hypothetical protein